MKDITDTQKTKQVFSEIPILLIRNYPVLSSSQYVICNTMEEQPIITRSWSIGVNTIEPSHHP